MKTHYSIADLLALNIPNYPTTRRGWEYLVNTNKWEYREVPSRGKGGLRKEYELSDEVKLLVCARELQLTIKDQPETVVELANDTGVVVAESALPVVQTQVLDLTNAQREIAENRLFLVRWIQQKVFEGYAKTHVIMEIVTCSRLGNLFPPELLDAVCKANAKGAGKCVVSRRSLFDWVKDVEDAEKHGINVIALLAPKLRESKAEPEWAVVLLNLYRTPQNPTLAAALEQLSEHYQGDLPSYHTAYRFINEKVGKVELQKGRMGKRELKNIQPFIRRDTSKLMPTDVYTADGHRFDAEVAHPMHGKPFRPEITAILDVATRRIVGWSVSLAESSWTVLDAFRMCAVECGIPAIFYVDNGSGYKNDLLAAQGRGVLNRLGVTVSHALPYNSQAKGLIERSHQTLWVKAAKKLPTYIGKPMDSEASNYAFKTTRKEIAEFGQSKLLMPWIDFLAFASNVVDEYNNKPHKGLKRIVDTTTGKSRYQSPLEAWNTALDLGAPVEMVADWDAEDLFRPYEERKVLRGEISLFNNKYFAMELEQFHGENVLVGYDIHNAQQITVRNLEGRFICYAVWNANKRDYYPVPKVQQARELRAAGRHKRLAAKQQEVREELSPTAMLEHMESQTVIQFPMRDRKEIFAELEALVPKQEQPVFKARRVFDEAPTVVEDDEPLSRWLRLDEQVLGGDELSDDDKKFWKLFQMSKKFKRLSIDDDVLCQHLEMTEQQRTALGF